MKIDENVKQAIARQRTVVLNEHKVRMLKQQAVEAGWGEDALILILDPDDDLARQVHAAHVASGGRYEGQDPRPGSDWPILLRSYRSGRAAFSEDRRRTLDIAGPDDIRVAVLQSGHVIAAVIPARRRYNDQRIVIKVETTDREKVRVVIPPGMLGDGRDPVVMTYIYDEGPAWLVQLDKQP
jgi:hypothetical protein